MATLPSGGNWSWRKKTMLDSDHLGLCSNSSCVTFCQSCSLSKLRFLTGKMGKINKIIPNRVVMWLKRDG